MTPKSIQALTLADNLLPYVATPHSLGNLLCTLVYLKVWSDNHLAQSTILQTQGQNPEEIAATLAQRGLLVMQAASYFSACHATNPLNTAAAIGDALSQLERDNPDLLNALQPLHFGLLNGLYITSNANPASLSRVVRAIEGVSFENPVPSMGSGAELTTAIATVCSNSNANARTAAPLIASLLAPQPNHVVLDLACGQGHLLWALAAELARTRPEARLALHGMEDDEHQWRIAKLLFSVSGLAHGALLQRHALQCTSHRSPLTDQALQIGAADRVVLALPETPRHWHHELACNAGAEFFPVRPPQDSRIALIWLSLMALKPEGGRMALLMSAKALDGQEGLALRKHLVDMNLLEAVLSLPALKGQTLLLIRRQKTHANVAFIQVSKAGEAGLQEALAIAQAWQCGKAQAKLIVASTTTLAQHHYPLDLRWYQAPDSVRFPKAPVRRPC